jgi:hypothetical protein
MLYSLPKAICKNKILYKIENTMLRLNQKVLESINSLRGVKSKKYEFFVCITTLTFYPSILHLIPGWAHLKRY